LTRSARIGSLALDRKAEKEVEEQAFDRCAVVADLVVAARCRRRMLEPVERALAGERSTVFTFGIELTGERREHRVVPKTARALPR
jgi:hypothetical protein